MSNQGRMTKNVHMKMKVNRVLNRTYQTEQQTRSKNEINFAITSETKEIREDESLLQSPDKQEEKTSKFGGNQPNEDFSQAVIFEAKSNAQLTSSSPQGVNYDGSQRDLSHVNTGKQHQSNSLQQSQILIEDDKFNNSLGENASAANDNGFVHNQRPRTGKTVPTHFGISYHGKLIYNQASKVPR